MFIHCFIDVPSVYLYYESCLDISKWHEGRNFASDCYVIRNLMFHTATSMHFGCNKIVRIISVSDPFCTYKGLFSKLV